MAIVLPAIGPILLEAAFNESNGRVLARVGAGTFFLGSATLLAAEAMQLPAGQAPYPLTVVYVVLAFLSQAAIGGALLQSGLLPAWIGWTTILWNAGLLVACPPSLPLGQPRSLGLSNVNSKSGWSPGLATGKKSRHRRESLTMVQRPRFPNK